MECEHNNAKCIQTKMRDSGYRYRRYKCKDCGERFTTVEMRVFTSGVRGGAPLDYLIKQQINGDTDGSNND